MFIVSKKNFLIRRADGSSFLIRKDFVGEIPADVAENWMVQGAIADGTIATPQGKKDAALEAAAAAAAEKAAESDIRLDAPKGRKSAGVK